MIIKTVFAISLCFFTLDAFAQLSWQEVNIPMSDDQSLKADIYLPANWTSGPAILIQTPYNKNLYHFALPIGIGQAQSTMGYAIVILDWRGFWNSSSAAYQGAPTMGEDGYDAVEWIAAQPWCNGKVGTWGPSALGKVQFATARQQPPSLKCIVPVVASSLFEYSEYYPGGVYRVEYMEQLFTLGFGTSTLVIANPYDNAAWTIAENLNDYPDEIEIPALMIAGWYDHNIDVMIPLFAGLQNESPLDVRNQHRLLVGPWVHGGSGIANPGTGAQGELNYPEAVGWNHNFTWQFFDYHLKNIDNGMNETAKIQYFQMGENDWNNAALWPIGNTTNTNLYFQNDGSLRTNLPADSDASLTFEYDPADPSPTIGGPTLRNDLEQGPYDQTNEVESRDDILIFTTQPLSENVVLQGMPQVKLKISSDVSDTDFAIRLCDVYPDGRSMLVCDGIFRMRFRNGFTQADESFMTAGTIYDCTVDLSSTALTFLAGHRIRVDVTSSNYPRFNRNMNTGGIMYPNNNGDILVNAIAAENTVHTSSINPSHLVLPIIGEFPSVGVAEQAIKNEFFIYPNPAEEQVNILRTTSSPALLRIIDAQGNLIDEMTLSSIQKELITLNYSSGIYSIVIIDRDSIQSKRLVIK